MKKNNRTIKNVWIFQTGEPVHSDTENTRKMRAINLANKLNENNYKVTLWTTDFYHQKKIHRHGSFKKIYFSDNLEIRFIPSPGYKKNISLKRLYDHLVLGFNLYALLNKENKVPDIAFIGYPPIETAFIFGRWLKNNNVPFIVDVKDMWPEIFLKGFPHRIIWLGKLMFFPYFFLSKKVISYATGISSMTSAMLDRYASKSGKQKSKFNKVFRLTSERSVGSPEKQSIEWWAKKKVKIDQPIILFIGSFMSVFNFTDIQKVAEINPGIQFVLAGDGDYLSEVKKSFEELENVFFPGWILENEVKAISLYATAFIAPYERIENFLLNFPNKIVDSLKYGKPIITSLHGEVGKLIKANNIGFLYEDHKDLNKIIIKLVNDKSLQREMSENASNLYNREFEFNSVYGDFVNHLEWVYDNWEKEN